MFNEKTLRKGTLRIYFGNGTYLESPVEWDEKMRKITRYFPATRKGELPTENFAPVESILEDEEGICYTVVNKDEQAAGVPDKYGNGYIAA